MRMCLESARRAEFAPSGPNNLPLAADLRVGRESTRRRRCLQYVRFGLEQPGRFVVLFGSAGRPTPPEVSPQELPGWPAFAGFIAAIETCVDAGSAPHIDPQAAALRLWVALHGMTVLRVSKKGFPWPPVERLVDELLQDLVLNSTQARQQAEARGPHS
jgi:hypothetical protein